MGNTFMGYGIKSCGGGRYLTAIGKDGGRWTDDRTQAWAFPDWRTAEDMLLVAERVAGLGLHKVVNLAKEGEKS